MIDYPIWPIISAVIIGFAAWSENGSQNCIEQCNNSPESISEEDSAIDMIDKIQSAVNNQHKVVDWRRVMIISIVLAIVITIILSAVSGSIIMPSGFTILMLGIILFVILYFSAASISSYWWENIDNRINYDLLQLRHQIQDRIKFNNSHSHSQQYYYKQMKQL